MIERQKRGQGPIHQNAVEAELEGKLSVEEALVAAVLEEYPPVEELRARTDEDVVRLDEQAFERQLERLGEDVGDPDVVGRTRTARDYNDLLQRAATERSTYVESARSVLTGEEQTVLDLRFGLGGEAPKSLHAVSRAIERSASRVRRIERWALAKLVQMK